MPFACKVERIRQSTEQDASRVTARPLLGLSRSFGPYSPCSDSVLTYRSYMCKRVALRQMVICNGVIQKPAQPCLS